MESGYGQVRTNGALSGAVEGAVSPVIFSPDNALIESG